LATQGQKILDGVAERIDRFGCSEWLSISGHPSWSFLAIKDTAAGGKLPIKTLFLQEVLARGILTLGSHNLSFAHTDADVARLLEVYDEVLPFITAAVADGRVAEALDCEALRPLFRVR
jgi:glutamate-1-semialdehyde 2,1-aminomutase